MRQANRLFVTCSLVLVLTAALSPRSAIAAPAATNATGPDVTIIEGGERTVYEYRQGGQLRIIKVVPKIGPSYYLVPRDETRGFGDLENADMLVPRWVLIEF